MAYQPKSYRKFVATAATATLVATAVTPAFAAEFTDVNKNYKEAVDYLVANKIANGTTETTFGTDKTISRGDAAVMIANALQLDVEKAPESPLTDLNSRVKGAVNALYAAKIVGGKTETTFKPEANITRAEMAKILTNAYKLEAGNTKNSFKDVNNTWDPYVDALLANKITAGKTETTFAPDQAVTRGEFALFMFRAKDFLYEMPAVSAVKVADDKTLEVTLKDAKAGFKAENFKVLVDGAAVKASKVEADEKGSVYKLTIDSLNDKAGKVTVNGAEAAYDFTAPKVESVMAINATTLTIAGSGLKNLKAEDITVEGNKVATIQSTDGKTATVTLEGTLPANTDIKVTVKDSVSTKDYTVKYGFEPKAVAVQAATYDDDTKGQKLAVTVDGVATSVDYLLAAGYTVEFNAFDKDGVSANTTLFGAAAASKDGKLQDAVLTQGDYTVQVVVAKGSTVLTSEKAKITVKNLDNAATAINSYELTNGAGFVQNTSTLVIGETATLTKVVVGAGSAVSELVPGSFEVKSSDETVVAVDSATGVLTAQGLGTAKVTITVGKVSKEVTVTVKGEARKVAKATPATNATKAIIGATSPSTIKVKVTDQYGDPVKSATSGAFAYYPTAISGYATTPVELDSSASDSGSATVSLAGATTAGQSGTVVLKNAKGDVLGSFTVTTTAVDNAQIQKLAYDSTSKSDDDSINADLASDNNIVYKIKEFTSENVYKQDVANLGGYKVKYNKDIIKVDSDTTGDYTIAGTPSTFTVTPNKAGSTTLAVYKPDGTLVETKTITVTKGSTKITGVAWKSAPVINYTTKIDYKTVLDITEGTSTVDDIVKGITLSSPVLNNIRIAGKASTGVAADGDLYIDKNDNGVSDTGETVLGKLSFAATASSTGALNPASPVFGDGFAGFGVTVATPAKGSIIFSITDETSTDAIKPVVATKAVTVDVK
ncbi:S-layer homology domain-containing protein [Bacillus sp. REN10]|uniref:S-layer homology domain-containing protein n=1 Tax=Bacillus sp. REN10 TaxID=2782541 RepID=UPI00193C2307|nr:S-layer homology domain-containing protein [Bacillus sp. REN10]